MNSKYNADNSLSEKIIYKTNVVGNYITEQLFKYYIKYGELIGILTSYTDYEITHWDWVICFFDFFNIFLTVIIFPTH